MFLLVIGATIFDVIHKKSAKYFFNNSVKAKKSATRNVGSGEKASLAFKTATNEVLTSSEFCSTRRRLAHLLTMYGFVLFVIATTVMIFSYSTPGSVTPSIWPLMWHLGAAMLCLGGYWFWFFIRVDVAAEGNKWYKIMRADLFVLSLIAMATFALIWSYLQSSQLLFGKLYFLAFLSFRAQFYLVESFGLNLLICSINQLLHTKKELQKQMALEKTFLSQPICQRNLVLE